MVRPNIVPGRVGCDVRILGEDRHVLPEYADGDRAIYSIVEEDGVHYLVTDKNFIFFDIATSEGGTMDEAHIRLRRLEDPAYMHVVLFVWGDLDINSRVPLLLKRVTRVHAEDYGRARGLVVEEIRAVGGRTGAYFANGANQNRSTDYVSL